MRISKCAEPTRGCSYSDPDKGSAKTLEGPDGLSSPTRGESTRGNNIAGSNEGNTESLERLEGVSSPTRGNDIAISEEGSTESLEWPGGFSSTTRGEWTGAYDTTAFSRPDLLVCLLSLVMDLCFHMLS